MRGKNIIYQALSLASALPLLSHCLTLKKKKKDLVFQITQIRFGIYIQGLDLVVSMIN